MNQLESIRTQFIRYCKSQKRLSYNTIKAYLFDLNNFVSFLKAQSPPVNDVTKVTKNDLADYLGMLNDHFSVKTAKRRLACLRTFYNFLEDEELVDSSPFNRFRYHIRENYKIRETMTLEEMNWLLTAAYRQEPKSMEQYSTEFMEMKLSRRNDVNLSSEEFLWARDVAVLELLFTGGLRVSELCDLNLMDFSLSHSAIRVHGKGNKERLIYLENEEVITALQRYLYFRYGSGIPLPSMFVTRFGQKLSSQAVRNLITKYVTLAGLKKNITPHVFRHTFATLLLEEGVDIKYIQDFLGHSSISTTQIYLHTTNKQKRKIIANMHPRQRLSLSKISSCDNVKLSSEGEDNLN
ncbi:tyrosine-type recombinase/integrase [Sinanaerobacter chloroacetimidivorans]|jgi:site-specific recombinase XerD|uniref:Tyrosine-type recombinase/integrase n=1 Tax=Sinanaerobacter chloroacetimidivorans TaxID=2818044 RepID=A0A8J7W7F0_9FIRM|nr:tyrosine-type recombinase/integrase [Sinanaerobacter chloroacetimidivorans]MBR0600423.1 tyrosine-type recombinase/integrase [Sinanaerobacter chloroacetimidivorans]